MIRKWLSFRTLSIALALILFVTAALKLHLLLTDPFADIKTGTSLPLLWLAVFAEAGVVWIVFSKAADQLKWIALISLFGVMTAVSAYNVVVGKTSCGCAGAIEIMPTWFFLFDLISIAILFFVSAINTFFESGESWSTRRLCRRFFGCCHFRDYSSRFRKVIDWNVLAWASNYRNQDIFWRSQEEFGN